MMNKKGYMSLIVMITLLAGLVTVGSYLGILDIGAITGSGSYIERPVFYYDKCEQSSTLMRSAVNTFNNQWLTPKPSATDSYNVLISDINPGKTSTPFINLKSSLVYSVCNSKTLNEDNCPIFKEVIIITSTTITP